MTTKGLEQCPRCQYQWEPRVPDPKECPRCKARLDKGTLPPQSTAKPPSGGCGGEERGLEE
jgi:uncharacterized paraquat-inducible protein A